MTTDEGACGSCAAPGGRGTPGPRLLRLGTATGRSDVVAALAGNPNTGKSTIFNTLTGLRQHVGNWAGKTVARAEGGFRYRSRRYRLVDLPGTYSLLSTSTDEEIARDFLLFGRPDVTIVVVDATRLERTLNLALQVLEVTDHAVVAVNLADEARRHGITLDTRYLARELGVPVVPTAARRSEGVPELLAAVDDVVTGAVPVRPHRVTHREPDVERAVRTLDRQLARLFPHLPNRRWVALRLLEGIPGSSAPSATGRSVPSPRPRRRWTGERRRAREHRRTRERRWTGGWRDRTRRPGERGPAARRPRARLLRPRRRVDLRRRRPDHLDQPHPGRRAGRAGRRWRRCCRWPSASSSA